MSKTSFNIQPCNVGSSEEHNKREKEYMRQAEAAGKLNREHFPDRTPLNECWVNPDYDGKALRDIREEYVAQYRQRFGQSPIEKSRSMVNTNRKTGRTYKKIVPGWSPIREACGPIKPNTRIEDFSHFIGFLREMGVRVIAIYLHRDEGKEDPVTGKRRYNYHYHMILDFFNPETKRTIKLKKDDLREAETALAESLGMERGLPKEQTHVRHRSVAEQHEFAAEQHLLQLNTQITETESTLKELNRRAEYARRKIEESERQATLEIESATERIRVAREAARIADVSARRRKKRLQNRFMDVVARVLNIVGRGEIATAHGERDEALRQAAEEREARRYAEQKMQEVQDDCRRIENEKWLLKVARDSYGKECYESGHQKGYDTGLQEGEQNSRDKISELEATLKKIKKSLQFSTHIFPYLKIVDEAFPEMINAGINTSDIRNIFIFGEKEGVRITIKEDYSAYETTADVKIQCSRNDNIQHVYFNNKRLHDFKTDFFNELRTSRSYGVHR